MHVPARLKAAASQLGNVLVTGQQAQDDASDGFSIDDLAASLSKEANRLKNTYSSEDQLDLAGLTQSGERAEACPCCTSERLLHLLFAVLSTREAVLRSQLLSVGIASRC